MTKKEIIKQLNNKIDKLILTEKTHTKEYKRLTKLHKMIIKR